MKSDTFSADVPLRRNTNIHFVTRSDLNHHQYYIICNLNNHKFIRLSPDFFDLFMNIPIGLLWSTATNFCQENRKELDRETAEQFIQLLKRTGLLIPESSSIADTDEEKLIKEPLMAKIGKATVQTTIPIKRADIIIERAYRIFGRFLFNRCNLSALLLFSSIGLFLYFQQSSQRIIGGDLLPLSLGMAPFIWIGVLISVFLHEMGHALTCRHFKRPVSSMGFILYLGVPGAFVDTSSTYMLPKWQRIAVDLAGIALNIAIVAGMGFGALLCRDTVFTLLFYIGLINLFMIIFNLIPFAKYDGYYAITDLFDYPNLRAAALSTVFSRRIWHSLMHQNNLSREESVLFGFGIASVFFTAIMLALLILYVYVRLHAVLPAPVNDYIPALVALFLAIAMIRCARSKIKMIKEKQFNLTEGDGKLY